MKPNFLSKKLNEKGLGLIEVMVAAAVATIVIFGVGNIIINSQKAQKNVQLGQNAGFFTNQLASMYTGDCPMSSMGYVYNTTTLANPVNMNFGTVNMGTGNFVLAAGSIIPNMDLQINSLRMKNLSDGPVYQTNGVNYRTHNAALYISFTKLGDTLGVKTGKETVLGVSLVTNDTTDVVVKCSFHGSTGATSISTSDYATLINQASQTACESNGGVWVPPTSTVPGTCTFPPDCKYYGSYALPGAGAGAGATFINPFTGAYSCPSGSAPFQQGTVTTAVSCGKSCVRSVFTPIYTCMKCGSTALTSGGTLATNPCGAGCNLSTHSCFYSGSGWSCTLLDSSDPTSGGQFP